MSLEDYKFLNGLSTNSKSSMFRERYIQQNLESNETH